MKAHTYSPLLLYACLAFVFVSLCQPFLTAQTNVNVSGLVIQANSNSIIDTTNWENDGWKLLYEPAASTPAEAELKFDPLDFSADNAVTLWLGYTFHSAGSGSVYVSVSTDNINFTTAYVSSAGFPGGTMVPVDLSPWAANQPTVYIRTGWMGAISGEELEVEVFNPEGGGEEDEFDLVFMDTGNGKLPIDQCVNVFTKGLHTNQSEHIHFTFLNTTTKLIEVESFEIRIGNQMIGSASLIQSQWFVRPANGSSAILQNVAYSGSSIAPPVPVNPGDSLRLEIDLDLAFFSSLPESSDLSVRIDYLLDGVPLSLNPTYPVNLKPCKSGDLTLSVDPLPFTGRDGYIRTQGTVGTGGQKVVLKAGTYVRLSPGFHAESNVCEGLHAFTEVCEAEEEAEENEDQDIKSFGRQALSPTREDALWRVGPNPSNEFFDVILDFQADSLVEVILRDLTGRLVQTHQPTKMKEGGQVRFRVLTKDLPSGVYLCQLKVADHILSQKVMVRH
ncbi:MAG: T9SS type A sorting domain-containing protein [Bacteroidota bacterium]